MSTETQPSEHAMRALSEIVEAMGGKHSNLKPPVAAHIIDQHAIAPAVAERDRRIKELATLLQAMLNVADNCDETGYADGVGFVDVDKLHEQVRVILAKHGGAHE